MRDWKPPRGMGPNYMHIREWAIDQTARAITTEHTANGNGSSDSWTSQS